MRSRVLETILSLTTGEDKKGHLKDKEQQPFRKLFEAQTSFYSTVSSILSGEVTFKIFFVLWSAIKTLIESKAV
jgi:hypothetical protein